MSPSCWLNSFERNCAESFALHFIADYIYVMGRTNRFYKTMEVKWEKASAQLHLQMTDIDISDETQSVQNLRIWNCYAAYILKLN